MAEFIPYTPLQQKEFNVIKLINPKKIVIRLQDLMESSVLTNKIKISGGLNKFLRYNSNVILSTIMKDYLLDSHLSIKKYVSYVKISNIHEITSIDSYTYSDHPEEFNWKQVNNAVSNTKKLLKLLPNHKIIALVKGANREQVDYCAESFRKMGIKVLGFPCGDFLSKPSSDGISKVKEFSKVIKKYSDYLILFGLSSPYLIPQFKHVDAFSGFSYYTNAHTYGYIFTDSGKIHYSNISVEDAIKQNYMQTLKSCKGLKKQKSLGDFHNGKQ